MTRFRVPFSGLAIAAVGLTAVSLDAYSQVAKASGRARLIGTNSTYCDNYSSVTTYPDGAVDIQCTGGTPTPTPTPTPGTEKGVVVFSAPTRFDVPKAPSQTTVDVPITVTRQATVAGGVPTLGTATSNVIVMWGPCTPIGVSIPVTFQSSQQTLTLPANTIRGALGACGIALSGGDVNPNQKATNTSAFPTIVVGPEVTPTPSPTPSPTPTPTPITPPPAGGPTIGQACTNAAGESAPYPANAYWHGDMAARGGNQNVVDEVPGTIHVYKLPMGTLEGNIGFTSYTTLSPSSMKVEITISKCPGDVNYWKTNAAMGTGIGRSDWRPCQQLGNGDSAQLGWKSTASWYQCGVPPTEQWYMQWRVLENSCPSDHIGPCGQTFYWS